MGVRTMFSSIREKLALAVMALVSLTILVCVVVTLEILDREKRLQITQRFDVTEQLFLTLLEAEKDKAKRSFGTRGCRLSRCLS